MLFQNILTKLGLISQKLMERLDLYIVAIVACTVLALETVSFQAIVYVNDYLAALQVISVALLGISLGGLVSFFVSKSKFYNYILTGLLVVFPVTVAIGLPIIAKLSATPILMMGLLTSPYIVASIIISTMFNRLKPSTVYLFDLVGAGLGVVIAVIIIPSFREEGSFFFLSILASLPVVIFSFSQPNQRLKILTRMCGVISLIIGASLLVLHLALDPFNLVYIAEVDEAQYPDKIFKPIADGKRDLLSSRGSLVERIDFVKWKGVYGRYASVYNARVVDLITSNPGSKKGGLDARLPTRLKLGENPDTLLVGPSAQGLTKAVKNLGYGHVDAVEINAAVAGLMTKEFFTRSGEAYKGLDLTIGDVRSFLASTSRKYDFITLLNTHRIWSVGHTGGPEYCHTEEAVNAYFDHMKENGFLLFEERNINDQAGWGIKRFLRTTLDTMKKRGIKKPEKHVAIWELWHSCSKKEFDKNQCPRQERFTFLMFKASPIKKKEYEHLVEWAGIIDKRQKEKRYYIGVKWQYLPQDKKENEWTDAVLASNIYDLNGAVPNAHNLGTITDDLPYSFDIYKDRKPQWSVFWNTAILSLVMLFLPAIVSFFARRGSKTPMRGAGRYVLNNMALILFFAILGIGYLLVEIVLIQKFAIFLTSPVWAMAVVLGILLVSSGIGGYFSAKLDNSMAVLPFIALIGFIGLAYAAYGSILNAAMFLPFLARIAFACVLIAPLGFAMGMPFPYGISVAKKTLSKRHAGLLFGINGALGAVATPLAFILSQIKGFNVTLLAGGGAYILCHLLLSMVTVQESVEIPNEKEEREEDKSQSDNAYPPLTI